jgi:hypothetical protein
MRGESHEIVQDEHDDIETGDSTCQYNRQSLVFKYSTTRLCWWGSPSTLIKPYNKSAMASTLETMQGSTGIVMRHQPISQDNQRTAISNNQTSVSSYIALKSSPSIRLVARGATPSSVNSALLILPSCKLTWGGKWSLLKASVSKAGQKAMS